MSIKERIVNLFKPIDLTEGKPLKSLLIFMVPILLSLIFQQIYTISDSIIVGQNLSSQEVAGVNDVYGLFFIVIQFAFGCTAGFSVITSNKAGAKDEDGIRKSFATQIILSVITSILLTVIFLPLVTPLLNLIGLNQDNNSFEYAKTYLSIIYIGIFAQIFYNLIVSVLRSIGDSLTPLLFLIGSTILNIVLDVLFIVVFKWEVAGAAFATILSQFLAAFGCFVYTFIRYKFLRLKLSDFKTSWSFTFEHLKQGIPLAFQFSILAIGLIILQKAVINFDTSLLIHNAQIGYGVGVKYNDFLMTPFNAIGAAMLSYSGQNYGAKNLERINEGLKASIKLMLCFYIGLAVLGISTSVNGSFVYLFLNPESINDRVKFYASTYMIVDCSFYVFLGLLFIFRNTLQGVQKPIYPLISGIVELLGRFLIVFFIPSLVNPNNPVSDASYIGLAFSDMLAWTFSILAMSFGIIHYLIKGNIRKDFVKTKTNA